MSDTLLVTFRGKVRVGQKRGRTLGFPTVNVLVHKRIPEGIYVSEVSVGRTKYHAATFVGSNKTFGEREYKAESYLLDFDEELYGKWITITVLKKLRENKRFSSAEALISQMNQDREAVIRYFSLLEKQVDN